MTDSSPFSPGQASLALDGLLLTAGRLRPVDTAIRDMVTALPASGSDETCILGHAGLARAGGTGWSEQGLSVMYLGEPYWLGTGAPADAEQIGVRYRAKGESLLDDLAGHFALVLADQEAETVLCAVDRFARESLYWHGDGSGIAVASTADALVAHPDIDAALSEQGLFNYLFFHMVPAPDTVYRGLHKLPAAHCLSWRQGQLSVRPYWLPEFDESVGDSPELQAGVLDNLRDAVARADTGAGTGSFLSGGLDSSTVSGLLGRLRPGADVYSMGFDADGYDEISYARTAVEHFGLSGHEYYVRPADVLAALPSVAAAYDEPFGNSSALPALFCAALARRDGRTRLLAGDGGDELYAGNARYAKQKVFELYQGLPRFMQATLRSLTALVPDGAPLLGKARSYVAQASVPLPDRLQTYNYVYRLGADAMFSPDFRAAVDCGAPFALEREIYRRPTDASTLNRMLYLDWHHTLADNDLRKVGRMCALAGIEVRYPMLDDGVVRHSLRVPSRLKLPGQRLRDFYKRATSDFLPARIIDKPKQGFGLPFGVWLAETPGLKALAGDNLQRLRRRGILRPEFVDRALALHQQEHAHYYGELVWVMVMLELWLTSRGFEP